MFTVYRIRIYRVKVNASGSTDLTSIFESDNLGIQPVVGRLRYWRYWRYWRGILTPRKFQAQGQTLHMHIALFRGIELSVQVYARRIMAHWEPITLKGICDRTSTSNPDILLQTEVLDLM
jgi:hypothetical protein